MRNLFLLIILVVIFSQLTFSQFSKLENTQDSEVKILYTSKKVQLFEKMTWVLNSGEIYSYDENNKLQSKITYINDHDKVENRTITRYTYLGNTRIDSISLFSENGEQIAYKNILTFNDDGLLLDSTRYQWKTSINDWEPLSKVTNHYDNNLLIEQLNFEFLISSGEFYNRTKITYDYDSLNRLLFKTSYGNHDGEWSEIDRFVYEYNDTTKLLKTTTFQRWRNNKWRDDRKSEFTYNENGKLIEEFVTAFWFGKWHNYRKFISEYADGLLSSYTTIIWDDETWKNYTQLKYLYDENQNITEKQLYYWSPNDWLNDKFITYNYDQKGNILKENIQKWNEDWYDYQKHLFEYNNKKHLISDSLLQYDSASGSWVNVYKNDYSYDQNGNRLDSTFRLWFESNNDWSYIGRVLYSYDNNKLSEEVIQNWIQDNDWRNKLKKVYEYTDSSLRITNQNWIDSSQEWINSIRQTTYYNAEGNPDSILTEKFSELNYWWRNQSLISFEYEDEKLIKEFEFRWLNRWVPKNETEYIYENDNLTELKIYMLTDTSRMLGDYYQYTYDKNNVIVSSLHQFWDTTRFVNIERIDYTYEILTDIEDNNLIHNNFVIFPNPNTALATLKCDLNEEELIKIEIFDNQGIKVRDIFEGKLKRGISYLELNNSSLTAGIYFIKIKGKDFIKVIKMIKY